MWEVVLTGVTIIAVFLFLQYSPFNLGGPDFSAVIYRTPTGSPSTRRLRPCPVFGRLRFVCRQILSNSSPRDSGILVGASSLPFHACPGVCTPVVALLFPRDFARNSPLGRRFLRRPSRDITPTDRTDPHCNGRVTVIVCRWSRQPCRPNSPDLRRGSTPLSRTPSVYNRRRAVNVEVTFVGAPPPPYPRFETPPRFDPVG